MLYGTEASQDEVYWEAQLTCQLDQEAQGTAFVPYRTAGQIRTFRLVLQKSYCRLSRMVNSSQPQTKHTTETLEAFYKQLMQLCNFSSCFALLQTKRKSVASSEQVLAYAAAMNQSAFAQHTVVRASKIFHVG